MLFNSFAFVIFLPLVFSVYWLARRSIRGQNLIVVAASYLFYGWWDWRFLILIAFTSLWSWCMGILELKCWSEERGSKVVLVASLVVNLGILGVFKYFNFFIDSAVTLLQAVGFDAHPSSLKIVLPVGISFYTFQALSYTIDVYRRNVKPTRDIVAFFAFVSFFPQLVAGPIERASNLLPQFLRHRSFEYPLAVEGCRQIGWGFFKKVVVADTCAVAANAMLGADSPSCPSLWVGMLLFTFQIYGDFSGYSDIAIGCGKLFGIQLMQNFRMPYFSRDIAEFWRRWHISLTTWFRDYVYIPLGGSRRSLLISVRNTFVVFAVSGLWHGANWTFVLWGVFHACCFLPLLLTKRNRKYVHSEVATGRLVPSFKESCQMLLTFFLALIGWTLFRAPDISTAWQWFKKMFAFKDWTVVGTHLGHVNAYVVAAIILLVLIEWFNRGRAIPALPQNRILRWCVYYAWGFMILIWTSAPQTFIYFQF